MERGNERFYREFIAKRCGGQEFDAPGGGYAFSAILAEERELAKKNIHGNSESALLALSVADPIWKVNKKAFVRSLDYFLSEKDASRYTDNKGIFINGKDTNEMLANIFSLPSPDWVQYSPGAIKRALAEYIPSAFFQKDDVLIFPNPGYPIIKNSINNRGIHVHDINMSEKNGKWRMPLIDFHKIHGRKRFMYVNIPHNPTGATYTTDELKELINWAITSNVLLIIDEAYTHIRYDDSPSILRIDGWDKCCIVLQSISKGWSATGLRFGWMIANPVLIKALRKVCDVKDSGMFGPTIAMGLACLENPEWAEETNLKYRKLHKLLYEGLQKPGFQSNMPGGGLCQFTHAPRVANGNKFDSLVECVKWFREKLRISLMHYEVAGKWHLRWAVTIKPVPECGLDTEESAIQEVVRRLQRTEFRF